MKSMHDSNRRSSCPLLVVVLLLLAPASLLAFPTARMDGGMVDSTEAGGIILFGGITDPDANGVRRELSDTWKWNGTRWTQLYPQSSPSARAGFSMAYDSNRGRVLLFGGSHDNVSLSDTWVFRASDWQDLQTPAAPPARFHGAIAFDPVSDRAVLYGGTNQDGPLYDTWAFDGTTWSMIHSEGPRLNSPSMVYDETRGEILLLGLDEAGESKMYRRGSETWEELSPETRPTCIIRTAMVSRSHAGDVLLYGGQCSNGALSSSTWIWDGENWTDPEPSQSPIALAIHHLAYQASSQQTLLYGGTSGRGVSRTWQYEEGVDEEGEEVKKWVILVDPLSPGARTLFVFDGDPAGEGLWLFAGQTHDRLFSDLWLLRQGAWTSIEAEGDPLLCDKPAGAWDPDRQKLVVYCGNSSTIYEFNGETWESFNPGTRPDPRSWATMAYDPNLKKMVLFGGWTGFEYVSQTWTWDGVAWTQLEKRSEWPDARTLSAMFYDPKVGRIIIFGGIGRANPDQLVQRYNDQWSFDGARWHKMSPATLPGPRYGPQIGLDPLTGEFIMFGGKNGEEVYIDETWAWNGTTWRQIQPASHPSPRMNGRLAVDPSTGRLTLYGGYSGYYHSEIWRFEGSSWNLVLPNTAGGSRTAPSRRRGVTSPSADARNGATGGLN